MGLLDSISGAASSFSNSGTDEDHVEDGLDSAGDALGGLGGLASDIGGAAGALGLGGVSKAMGGAGSALGSAADIAGGADNLLGALTGENALEPLPPPIFLFKAGAPNADPSIWGGSLLDSLTDTKNLAHMGDNILGAVGGPSGLLKSANAALGTLGILDPSTTNTVQPGDWFVHEFRCKEGLNQLFDITVTLLRPEGAIPGVTAQTAADPLINQFTSPTSVAGAMGDIGNATKLVGDVMNDIKNPGGSSDKTLLDDMIAPQNNPYFNFFANPASAGPIDPNSILGLTCSVHLERLMDDGTAVTERYFSGICIEFEDLGWLNVPIHVVRLRIVPSLWMLSLRKNCRVYQNMNAIAIIRDVVQKKAGLYSDQGIQTFPGTVVPLIPINKSEDDWMDVRETCVQYNETDLDFVMRLMAEEGVSFYFDHQQLAERIVLMDNAKATGGKCKTINGQAAPFEISGPTAIDTLERVWSLDLIQRVIPAKVTIRDFNLSAPDSTTEAVSPSTLEGIADGLMGAVTGKTSPAAMAGGLMGAAGGAVGGLVGGPVGSVLGAAANAFSGNNNPGGNAEVYSYPGRFNYTPKDKTDPVLKDGYNSYDGADRAKFQLKQLKARAEHATAASNLANLMAGTALRLQTMPSPSNPGGKAESVKQLMASGTQLTQGEKLIITAVDHHCYVGTDPFANGGDGSDPTGMSQDIAMTAPLYQNLFDCIYSKQTPIKPIPVPAKPVIAGVQTATVIGPQPDFLDSNQPGDPVPVEIDSLGRIRVRFNWDRRAWGTRPAGSGAPSTGYAEFDATDPNQQHASSCWVRVAQPLAGAQFGVQFHPRIGMEVVVAFLEGDPDRPVVVGCVHNSNNLPPYALPKNKTMSAIVTQSVPLEVAEDTARRNELRFQDWGGLEEVYVRAQKTLREQVLGTHTTQLKNDHHNRVFGGGQLEEVTANQKLSVLGQWRTLEVTGTDTIDVGPQPDDKTKNTTSKLDDKAAVRMLTIKGNDVLHVLGERVEVVNGNETVTINGKGDRAAPAPADPPADPAPPPDGSTAKPASQAAPAPTSAPSMPSAPGPVETATLIVNGQNVTTIANNDVLNVTDGDRTVTVKGKYMVTAAVLNAGTGDPKDEKRSGILSDDKGVDISGKKSAKIHAANETHIESMNDSIQITGKQRVTIDQGKDDKQSVMLDEATKTISFRSGDNGIKLGWGDNYIFLSTAGLEIHGGQSTMKVTQAQNGPDGTYDVTFSASPEFDVNFTGEIHLNGEKSVDTGANAVPPGDPSSAAPPHKVSDEEDKKWDQSAVKDPTKAGDQEYGHNQVEKDPNWKYKPPADGASNPAATNPAPAPGGGAT